MFLFEVAIILPATKTQHFPNSLGLGVIGCSRGVPGALKPTRYLADERWAVLSPTMAGPGGGLAVVWFSPPGERAEAASEVLDLRFLLLGRIWPIWQQLDTVG